MPHMHPDSPDYLLLDQVVRHLDGRIGGDMLPIGVVVKDLDLEALRFMSAVRASKVMAAKAKDQHHALMGGWIDGFMAGLMFQRAKAEQGE